MAARLLHDHCEAIECLAASRVGRMMLARGLEHEVKFAAQKSRFGVVARLEDGVLRNLA
jgi:phosphosulfolactate phosphohydrolase-like enzyme